VEGAAVAGAAAGVGAKAGAGWVGAVAGKTPASIRGFSSILGVSLGAGLWAVPQALIKVEMETTTRPVHDLLEIRISPSQKCGWNYPSRAESLAINIEIAVGMKIGSLNLFKISFALTPHRAGQFTGFWF
jgi:hypothetical protein